MEEMKYALMHVGVFLIAYIPVILFLAPVRTWFPLALMGAAMSLMVFLVALCTERREE